MHELPLTKSIFHTVIQKATAAGAIAVRRVVLEIGILRDFIPEIVQKYWDYIAPGSMAEGAKIEIREVNARAVCGRCGKEYTITRETIQSVGCPACGYVYGRLTGGSELRIVGIEIERDHSKDEAFEASDKNI